MTTQLQSQVNGTETLCCASMIISLGYAADPPRVILITVSYGAANDRSPDEVLRDEVS